jgi:two-component system phosphate regulon sensor histidine kinase PhoR
MHKKANTLIIVCFSVMIALLIMQGYWVRQFYLNALQGFDKEVNLAFEDGIKKELELRCDTIQKLIEKKLLDTSSFIITSVWNEKHKSYVYNISSKSNPKDQFNSFSLNDYSKPVPKNPNDTSVRRHVAASLALLMRNEDLETHTIYYRTQDLGRYMEQQTTKFQFDTVRLRLTFDSYLDARHISVPYHFMVRKVDSTNNSTIQDSTLNSKFPVITKAFSTYHFSDNQRYVRAVFKNPSTYILTRMWIMICSSFLMICVVAGCMIFILKSLFKEKRLSNIKNDFISNITHEFKTPIATVAVAIEAISNQDIRRDEDKLQRYLGHAKNEITRLDSLVNKVLNISINEHVNLTPLKQVINIDLKMKELIERCQLSASKFVTITYQNNSDIKALEADETQFSHALTNIIDNSIKYSSEEVVINIELSSKNRFLEISIKDKGIGIAPNEQVLVFEKFYRVGTGNAHPVKGHGLGLNYVQQIMLQHMGWYKINSKLGTGTTITLGWPL